MSRNRRPSVSSISCSPRPRVERCHVSAEATRRERHVKKPEIDTDYLLRILRELLAIPSPRGFTDRVAMRACAQLEALGVAYELTRRGAIRADLHGRLHTPDPARTTARRLGNECVCTSRTAWSLA